MARRVRASPLVPEARLGRACSPVRFGAGFNSLGSTRCAVYPGEEKETMRGLNERLAGYLSQVRLLEDANSRLEAQIKEVLKERRAVGQRDWSGYEKTICTLRDQMKEMAMENARLMLQIDNTRLAADDFQVKLEAEIIVHQGVEQDLTNLRKVIDDTHMSRMQLESEVESLTEELIYLKKRHEEDVAIVKGQIGEANVDVQMETKKGEDLSETIDKIRQQYERAVQTYREETQAWYQAKFENISAEVSRNTDALQQGQSELNDLRRQKQGLEIDLQAMHSMNRSLEDTLNDTVAQYSQNINSHNMVIQKLEAELADVHAQVMRQGAEYQALLNIKSQLEEEIATYHSLLAGTGLPFNGIPNSRLPENGDFRGMGAREDINVKGFGPSADANIGGNGLGRHDESVEFSLEQALNTGPRYLIPDPTLNNEIVEEEMITQKDLELNFANAAMNKQYNQKEAGQRIEEDPEILEEIEKEKVEEAAIPVVDTQVEKVEEAAIPVVDTQVEKVEEAASPMVDIQVEKVVIPVVDTQVEDPAIPVVDTQMEKVEEAASPMVDTQVEKVEEAASPMVDIQVKEAASPMVETWVTATGSPMVDTQVEEAASPMVETWVTATGSPMVDTQVEEAASPMVETWVTATGSPMVDTQVEEAASPMVETWVTATGSPMVDTQVEEAASPVVDTQVKKVEEAASPTVDTQVEEAASPMVDTQAKEDADLKPSV